MLAYDVSPQDLLRLLGIGSRDPNPAFALRQMSRVSKVHITKSSDGDDPLTVDIQTGCSGIHDTRNYYRLRRTPEGWQDCSPEGAF